MWSEEYRERMLRAVNMPHQFSCASGVRILDIRPDYAEGELIVGPDSLNLSGNVHGGALCTLADEVAGCCACSHGGDCVTTNSTMEFLRPANGSKITCVATPKRMGRTLSVIQVELTNEQGAAVAAGTFTFYMLEPAKK